ncbi:MAG: glycoside hydrolase family 57 [Verrucomicrobiota bacterium]
MRKVFHALTLNFHQPPGNLEHLLATEEWAAKELLWAIDRMPRALWDYEGIGKVHLNLSGTLLETLSNPAFQERVHGIVKCGELLWHLQNKRIFDVLGSGYYHPVLPLIPAADREEQLVRWQGIAKHLFWRTDFQGFWPPEMAFSMELIPLLKRLGYRYVIVDSNYLEPVGQMRWEEIRYRPHIARYEDSEIIIVARDRELSDAQQSGMDAGWFMNEVHQRTKHCDFPPLVITATDGDNGGWFRNTNPHSNFWHACYQPLLDKVRAGETEIEPVFIHEYLDQHGAVGEVTVRTGAWNTGWHHGADFMQWTGSDAQKMTFTRIHELSAAFHETAAKLREKNIQHPSLNEAHWRLLRAQTSCNVFWGEDWVHRAHNDLDEVARQLQQVRGVLPEG